MVSSLAAQHDAREALPFFWGVFGKNKKPSCHSGCKFNKPGSSTAAEHIKVIDC